MPPLRILFAKAKDPSSQDVLTCIRQDGSRTWSKLHSAFPIHDMTHFAVETEMKAANGFFGLLAQGWNITDFGVPEKRAQMPLEALWVEHVVGVIWQEYITRNADSYETFSSAINSTISSLSDSLARNTERKGPRAQYTDREMCILSRRISEEDRASIMGRIGELASTWALTVPGQTMELFFQCHEPEVLHTPS